MPVSIFWSAAAVVLLNQLTWLVVALRQRDNGWADVGWGLGFGGIALLGLGYRLEATYQLLAFMVLLWALRLAGYLYWRKRQRSTEDFRYRQWREAWGASWLWRTIVQVFLLQGFFMYLIALPLLLAIAAVDLQPGWWGILGASIAGLGLGWEAMADYQLARFKAKAAPGAIMTTGLWRFCRHPNYFGELVFWWGIYLFCCQFSGAFWGFCGPLTLTWLLARVSGVPLLEARYRDNPTFQAYVARTPALIPGWPRRH